MKNGEEEETKGALIAACLLWPLPFVGATTLFVIFIASAILAVPFITIDKLLGNGD